MGVKSELFWGKTKFYSMKGSSKRNFFCHSSVPSPSFENSYDDKWALDCVQCGSCIKHVVTRDESNLSRFGFERITKRNIFVSNSPNANQRLDKSRFKSG